jgi:hypothetical protein
MPLIETKGAASSQGFGQFARASAATYIEDVFSTWLYTGNGSTLAISNGIDLAAKGGMVWIKNRQAADHNLYDTNRGVRDFLVSNATTRAQTYNAGNGLTVFGSSGFTMADTGGGSNVGNNPNANYASWTFRKQPKFFDVVTYTGNGANRTIAHNLGSVPGCIIVKRTDTTGDWQVYHRSLANTEYMVLNSLAAAATGATRWNSTTPTDTAFSLGTDASVNASGGTYVAYLFAHNAGGFGLTGTDNVISCGSFTTDGSGNATVNLGYEPQWLMFKLTNQTNNWEMRDTMRGFTFTVGNSAGLLANTSGAEFSTNIPTITSTGFNISWGAGFQGLYIAIRRGPMKVPTSGTSVFSPYSANTPGSVDVITGFPVDLQVQKNAGAATDIRFVDRLRGVSTTQTSPSAAFPLLVSNSAAAETTGTGTTLNWTNTSFRVGSTYSNSTPAWAVNFRRAPGFFDVVCYTGNDVTVKHGLNAIPELIISKPRNEVKNWYAFFYNMTSPVVQGPITYRWYGTTTLTNAAFTGNNSLYIADQSQTVSFAFGDGTLPSTTTNVAYLFASCPGVSKVGKYTGTGTTQQINCGFTGGARFVMIKRTDSTGDWYVWDSARGIVAGNDPYILLNSSAAEVTNTDYIDTLSTGFEISSTAPAAINANGGTFVYLAIA